MAEKIKIYKKGVLLTETTDIPTGLASFAMQLQKAFDEDNASLELQVFEANGKDASSLHFTKSTKKMHVNGHILYTDGDAEVPDTICDDNGQVVLSLCKHCHAGEIELDKPCTRAMG